MKGKFKWFSDEKGYGFITGEDGQDVFCHRKALPDGVEIVSDGQAVEFGVERTVKGLRAVGVKLLSVLLAFLAAAAIFAGAGCSGLQARGNAAVAIVANAADAQPILAAAAAGTLDANRARLYVADAGARLRCYYDQATINLLAYWFEADKQILCTASIYRDLKRMGLAGGVAAQQAAGSRPATEPSTGPIDLESLVPTDAQIRRRAVAIATAMVNVLKIQRGERQSAQ